MLETSLIPHFDGFIDGAWAPAYAADRFPVFNPATGELLAEIAAMEAFEAEAAIAAAATAMRGVRRDGNGSAARAGWLRAIADSLLHNKAEFARIVTLEQGKPLLEAAAEVEYAAGFFAFFAEALDRLEPSRLGKVKGAPGLAWTVYHRPTGVAGLITPWNFPLAMLAKKLAAALGAGCSVVIKPAELTPLSALALCHAATGAGVPKGMVNVVTGAPEAIGAALCTEDAVRLVSFTGSTEVGRTLAAQCAPGLKRLALELGGNAPFIVCADADIEAAADALMATKFRCAGQTFVCANRVYVDKAIEATFTEAVEKRVAALRVGNGMDEGIEIGPLINRAGFDKVARHVSDARERGARITVGAIPDRPESDWGAYYPPTVLTGVTRDMLVTKEETFGPVVAIATFTDIEEALTAANATPYGLAAYLFTSDSAAARHMALRLDFGHVAINSGHGPTPESAVWRVQTVGLRPRGWG